MTHESEQFDEQSFLDSVQKAAPESRYTPVPEDEYDAYIDANGVKVEVVTFKDGGKGKRFNATWVIDSPELAQQLGMQKLTVRQRFLLDLTPEGALADGKNQNIRLGKIFEAGNIDTSKGWSFRQLEGIRARIRVAHRPDREDASIVYPEVVAVTKAA